MDDKKKKMNKKSQYKTFEWQIIIGITLILLSTIIYIKDTGITGYATRTIPKTIEINQTKPILIEKPAEITSTTPETPSAEVQSECVVPYEDMVITTNTTLCPGTYYLNDSNYNGVLRITSNDTILDCNGATIIGNGSGKAIQPLYYGYSNQTIKNCNIVNFTYGILMGSPMGWNVYNNNISLSYYGIMLDQYPYNDSRGYNNIYNNYIYNSGYYGIYLQGSGHNNVYNNIVEKGSYGILSNRINYSSFYNNTVYNVSINAIRFSGDTNFYNNIYNNTVYNAGWNCLDVMGQYSNFTNNYLNNCSHFGLNANTDTNDKPVAISNFIANNVVNNSGACIYTDGVVDSLYENNSCYANNKLSIPDNTSKGISVDGWWNDTYQNYFTRNNTFIGNYLNGYNISIADHSINSSNKYINNLLENTNIVAYTENYFNILDGDVSSIILINNTKINGLNYYLLTNDKPKLLMIVDYNPLGAYFDMPNMRGLNKTYNGLINITITNTSIYFYNLSPPYNDIKNVSNGAILASNINNYTITLSPNQIIEVGNFVLDPEQENNPPVINSIILTDNLTCITNATDIDLDNITISIEWYYNNTFNRSVNASFDVQDNMTGTHYCRAIAYDGQNYSDWAYSNNVTISVVEPTILNLSLSNNLNCTGIVNIPSNITVDFYLNGIINYSTVLEVNDSFSIATTTYYGSWYCNVSINNNSYVSNIVTLSEPITVKKTTKNTGGSGGSSIISEQNIIDNTKQVETVQETIDKEQSVVNEQPFEQSAQQQQNTQQGIEQKSVLEEQKPVLEQPKDIVGQSYMVNIINKNLSIYAILSLIFIASTIIIFSTPQKPYRPEIEQFTIRALNDGYEYNAIRNVLRKYYDNATIDKHFHLLRLKNINTKKYPVKQVSITQKNIEIIKDYINKQKNNGFKEKDIIKALKNNGYSLEFIKNIK